MNSGADTGFEFGRRSRPQCTRLKKQRRQKFLLAFTGEGGGGRIADERFFVSYWRTKNV